MPISAAQDLWRLAQKKDMDEVKYSVHYTRACIKQQMAAEKYILRMLKAAEAGQIEYHQKTSMRVAELVMDMLDKKGYSFYWPSDDEFFVSWHPNLLLENFQRHS